MMKRILPIVLVALLSVSAVAEGKKQYLYVLKPMRVAMLTSGPTPAEAEALMGHVAYMEKLTADGTLLVGGRTQNNDATTIGLAIFVASSDAAAAEIMNADPVVKHGVMTATLYPYEIAFGTVARK